ncbi:hypothetical protein PGQ11_002963 [Apiospora arundinis]|uniref:Uncharacterized protein n=1 Tax=Apiospora arundinis TaxID=335852 RepID=A0ABR2J3R4_9PEZI
MGMSVSNWAPNKRSGKINLSQATRRNMKFKGWASLLMQERYRVKRSLSTEVVMDLLAEAKDRDSSSGSKKNGKAKVYTGIHDVAPTDLVRQLADQIHAEIPDLTFDYFALHDVCWEVLQSLKRGFEAAAGAGSMAIVIPQEDKLPHLAGYVFSGMKTPDGTTVPQPVLWQMAAAVVADGLARGFGCRIAEAGAAPVDANASVELELGDVPSDPWKLNSGDLMQFVMGQEENCPMQ